MSPFELDCVYHLHVTMVEGMREAPVFLHMYVLWCVHRNTSTPCDVKNVRVCVYHVCMYTYIQQCWRCIGLLCCLVFSDEYTHETMARTTTQSSLNKLVHLCARTQLRLEQGRRKSSECLPAYIPISLGLRTHKPRPTYP